MPITYAVKKIRNPKNPDVDYFHGQAVKTGELSMEKLAKRINNSTTVTQADCYVVLKSMKDHIIEALSEGQVVVLDDLGRFQVSLQGKCYNAATLADPDFKPAEMIRNWKVVFRPEPRLKEEIRKEFKLKRISSEALA
jgi:predicted histone-like DNA-binding protein